MIREAHFVQVRGWIVSRGAVRTTSQTLTKTESAANPYTQRKLYDERALSNCNESINWEPPKVSISGSRVAFFFLHARVIFP